VTLNAVQINNSRHFLKSNHLKVPFSMQGLYMFFKKTKVAEVATPEVPSIQAAVPRLSKRQKGFTLLELGFVVGLISIIVGGFAVYQNTDNAKATRAYADMTMLKDGVQRFQADTGMLPFSMTQLVDQNGDSPFGAGRYAFGDKWSGPYITGFGGISNISFNRSAASRGLGPDSLIGMGRLVNSPDGFYVQHDGEMDKIYPFAVGMKRIPSEVAKLISSKCGGLIWDGDDSDVIAAVAERNEAPCVAYPNSDPYGPNEWDVLLVVNPAGSFAPW